MVYRLHLLIDRYIGLKALLSSMTVTHPHKRAHVCESECVMCVYVCVCTEGKQEEKGFFGGVVESLVAHIVKVVQVCKYMPSAASGW